VIYASQIQISFAAMYYLVRYRPTKHIIGMGLKVFFFIWWWN